MDSTGNHLKKLTFKTFLKVYLRSFFIQGSFSIKYRQNTGFAFCMEPVGNVLWDEPENRNAFLIRHMEYFNGNPFMITLVLGAVTKMEEILHHKGGITGKDISVFKKAVGAATGSIGDRFFWSTLRPFGIITGLLLTLFYGVWGILLALAVFNIPNFLLRWHWLKLGYRLGTGIIPVIQSKKLERAVYIMENLGAILLAFITVVFVLTPDSTLNWVSAAAAVLFITSIILLKRAVSLSAVLVFSLVYTVISGLLLIKIIY